MKKQDEIAKLIGGTRKEADQFIQKINDALPERASLSEITYALRKLPAETRKLDDVIIALGGRPKSIQPQPTSSKAQLRPNIATIAKPPARKSGSAKQSRLRANWHEFEKIVKVHKIVYLYHFTDKANLPSIVKHGGLHSWYYCEANGIAIPCPGGNDLSRRLDIRHELQDYVRLGFNSNPPMLYSTGLIVNAVILEIDPSVIYWEDTLFSDINATDNMAIVSGDLKSFKKIRLDVATRQYWNGELEKKWRQAEVLVRTHVPLDLIRIPSSS